MRYFTIILLIAVIAFVAAAAEEEKIEPQENLQAQESKQIPAQTMPAPKAPTQQYKPPPPPPQKQPEKSQQQTPQKSPEKATYKEAMDDHELVDNIESTPEALPVSTRTKKSYGAPAKCGKNVVVGCGPLVEKVKCKGAPKGYKRSYVPQYAPLPQHNQWEEYAPQYAHSHYAPQYAPLPQLNQWEEYETADEFEEYY